ncbi:MAG: oligopeptide transporter, OPT family, partial [Bacteriovoracaceae bacterium]|nr:oligopeptide transporter, OPT family [Bacteriovoracaceae bacterium]
MKIKELTVTSISLGIIIGIVMTAANVYLGLYAGMTVSASIPAAVIAMGVFRGVLKKGDVHQSNIVQTMASAGESLAAGVIFTLPALVIVGAWTEFEFWPTTLIAISGGLLGIIFMIPLRRALIIDEEELTYPEGVACAAVLEEGAKGDGRGMKTILQGLTIGAAFKFLGSGMGLLKGSVERAYNFNDRAWFFGSDISPALMAVGYIVKLEVAFLVLIGGAIGWFVGIPMLGLSGDLLDMSALDASWELWTSEIRYLGVGAMLVGGVWSIFSVRRGFTKGIGELKNSLSRGKHGQTVARVDQDISALNILILLLINIVAIFFLYKYLIGNIGHTFLATIAVVVASFLFVAVSSYIVGLVGSSNNPVSGMTIAALLGTAALFLVLGYTGQSAILATLGVAAVVCCAACTAGDCSQDLKTGHIIKATPRSQQIAQIIGVVIPALVIAPVLSLLHGAYGIGVGLKAPQATLFASITNAIFGNGSLPYNMIGIGVILGIVILLIDAYLVKRKSKVRLYLMPLAVGIYLPITLAIPMFIGGVIRFILDRKQGENALESSDQGILLSSGLIAGEAIMGVLLAILLSFKITMKINFFGDGMIDTFSIAGMIAVAAYLYWKRH